MNSHEFSFNLPTVEAYRGINQMDKIKIKLVKLKFNVH